MILESIIKSFRKLNPVSQVKNPVMFVVYMGTLLCSILEIAAIVNGAGFHGVNVQVILWLWFTILFANFAESIAEAQGKARADSLKGMRKHAVAHRLTKSGQIENVPVGNLKREDVVVCESGDIIPGDGEVIEGIASVDESAVTGESAPVIRESGGDRSAVTGGTRVISDRIVIRVTSDSGNTFIDKIISMVENASRQKTPGEIALTILLSSLTIIFLVAVVTLYPFVLYSVRESNGSMTVSVLMLTALLVCLIPTTIGGLLSAIGIAGVARLLSKNVIALSGRAVEASGDIDVLLIDKTGTITHGNRMANELVPVSGISVHFLAKITAISSYADETPEGRSILQFVQKQYGIHIDDKNDLKDGSYIPFSAKTRMSGVDFKNSELSVRKGALESIRNYIGSVPVEIKTMCEKIANEGGTPLVVTCGKKALGVIYLKDIIKEGIKDRFSRLRSMGIKTVMITGDNPLTAAAIAAEAGVSDYIAEAEPETKLMRIREEQKGGHMIAMIGDGTNDAPALAQADVGVAMGSGTQTAREAGNMVDLDNDPTKLLDIVEIGKQLLMTRGALTTFSIANDLAKYFAILPAMFLYLYSEGNHPGPLSVLNIMHLSSPESAILSAVIFNALIIIALIPLALKGVCYSPLGAEVLMKRNLLVYGAGGIITPFVGIKLIDIIIQWMGIA